MMNDNHHVTCYWSDPNTEKPRESCTLCQGIDVELDRERRRIADAIYSVVTNPNDVTSLAAWIRTGAKNGITL
jgi:hypothetical protein